MTTATIPAGYRQDTMGRLVRESMVKEIDKLRDDLVCDLARRARDTSGALLAFKTRAFEEIESFVELSAAEYDQTYGGTKGNINLVSYDGRYKIQRAVSDHFEFDERLQVAKELIDACISDWTDESRPEVQMLINDAFQVDKKGNVSTKRIMSLRKFNIEDERWTKAMAAINDSLTVVGSRVYLRVYERIEGTDQWKQIPLDLASV